MIPTIEYLQERFDHYNDLCFEGALPRIPIKLSNARSFVGRLVYTPVRDWRRRVVGRKDFVLRISTCFDLSEEETEDTLIHEMIHYWIALNDLKDSSTHGKIFRAKMKEINERHGRHLTISRRSTPEELDRDKRISQHWLCVSVLSDGRTAVTVCARPCIQSIQRAFRHARTIRSMSWYCSLDPWFNRFPRCRTPKLFPVDPVELQSHLDGAETLVI